MAALTYAGRRVAFTFAVAPRARRGVRMRATVPDMPPRSRASAAARTAPTETIRVSRVTSTEPPADRPLTPVEKARRAGQASRAALTADEMRESVTRAARGAHGPIATARKLAARWPDAGDDEQREVRRILRAAGIIR